MSKILCLKRLTLSGDRGVVSLVKKIGRRKEYWCSANIVAAQSRREPISARVCGKDISGTTGNVPCPAAGVAIRPGHHQWKGFPLSAVAVILRTSSLSEIRKSAGRIAGRGLAITGVVLGYAGLHFTANYHCRDRDS